MVCRQSSRQHVASETFPPRFPIFCAGGISREGTGRGKRRYVCLWHAWPEPYGHEREGSRPYVWLFYESLSRNDTMTRGDWLTSRKRQHGGPPPPPENSGKLPRRSLLRPSYLPSRVAKTVRSYMRLLVIKSTTKYRGIEIILPRSIVFREKVDKMYIVIRQL